MLLNNLGTRFYDVCSLNLAVILFKGTFTTYQGFESSHKSKAMHG